MSEPTPSELETYRARRSERERHRRMLNGLPLAHRLLDAYGSDTADAVVRFGWALAGLREASLAYDCLDGSGAEDPRPRFGEFAAPWIESAAAEGRSHDEVETARAEILAAIATRERVRGLAGLLGLPVEALAGGLMDARVRERVAQGPRSLRGVA